MSDNNKIEEYLLPKQTSNKKTLVLDLDETLVHSQFQPFDVPSDITLTIELDNEIHDIYILVRPGVKQFLEKMSKIFEVVIFTASVSKYADPLIDIIDKENNCQYRLFREHCTQINDIFVKELKNLGRDLKDVIIVDNSPMSYCLNHENGLPILSWFDDKKDRELYNITPILEFLSLVPDVRSYINKFVVEDEICYKNVKNVFGKYNDIMAKNNTKKNDNNLNNKTIIKKNKLMVKSNQFFSGDNKENISNNIIQNKKKINKEEYNNNIIIRQNSKNKNNIKELKYYQINNRTSPNMESKENKENINNNIFDINSFFNFSIRELFIKQNQTTKNKDTPNLNSYTINSKPNAAPSKSYINLISKVKANKSNNKNFNIRLKNNLLSNHKKTDSVNGLKPLKKIYENRSIKINKSNNIKNCNNFILRHKNKSINKENSMNLIYNNNLPIFKNKSHKYGMHLSLRMNSELNYELEKLNRTQSNSKKLSKSLKKEKLTISKINDYKNNFCSKSSILNNSKINESSIRRIYHKKSKSIISSFIPLRLKVNKEENCPFIKKNIINKNKQKIYLSNSESYNNKNFLKNISVSKSNNSTINNTLTALNRKNNSLRKINFLKNKKLLVFNVNTNKEKKKENKIPYNINKKKNIPSEIVLRNQKPINKNILIKINNNIKNNRYKIDKIDKVDKSNLENTEPITVRPKSSKQIIYRRINRSINNNSFKEGMNNLKDDSQKFGIRNIINNIIYVNNIFKKNEIFVTKSFKQNK